MILWDVNLWVYAFRSDSPFHVAAREELRSGPGAGGAYMFCPHVAASFLRLVTNPRIFVQPSPVEEAWAFIDTLESRDRAVKIDVDSMAYGIFRHLCLTTRASGNRVPDALLAAVAMRHGATLVTADRSFGQIQGLACRFLEGAPGG